MRTNATTPDAAQPSAEPELFLGNRPYPWMRALACAIVGIMGLIAMFRMGFFLGLGILLLDAIVALRVLPYRINPLTARKLKRFKEIRRGYVSFLILGFFTILSLFAELFASNRALIVHHEGALYFPTYDKVHLGAEFGMEGIEARMPVNYRDLKQSWQAEDAGNWVLMPWIPYGPNEQIPNAQGFLRSSPPGVELQNYRGTDTLGRDILVRLIYGFRVAIFFALAFMTLTYCIGITIGCLMGYFGGIFDLGVQRLIEIWANVPFLYMVIIVFSVIPTNFSIPARVLILLGIMVLFSWTSMTYYMRTATYREKSRDYVAAALVLGSGTSRVIFNHILPNTVSTIVTFMPFTVVAAITAITALDFLGFGLPPPTPSLGELLKQGRDNLTTSPWIVTSALVTLIFLLTLVTFIGEAVREAFDPKKFTIYE